MVRVAINGFGRIGRMVFRKCSAESGVEVVAINALYPAETLVHLIKYDTVHGLFEERIERDGEHISLNGYHINLSQNRNPRELPWRELDVDIVIEATGKFTTKKDASMHIEAGAKKVIITAPSKDEDLTIVYGVNQQDYKPHRHHIVSNASCTTNCLAPIVKVLNDAFTIDSGMMTTIHSYTNDQRNIDNPHQDLRRARACGQSIIPTTTGAAKAIGKVLPTMSGKLHGMALRVPTPNVSLVDFVVNVNKMTSGHEVNKLLRDAAENSMKGIMSYTDKPLVSTDFNGNEHSSIVDGLSTIVMNDKTIKVLAWYDNEWGYSCRIVDLTKYIGSSLQLKSKNYVS